MSFKLPADAPVGDEEAFCCQWPVSGQCKMCERTINNASCSVVLPTRFICCQSCLIGLLCNRDGSYPKIGGRDFDSFLLVEPGERRQQTYNRVLRHKVDPPPPPPDPVLDPVMHFIGSNIDVEGYEGPHKVLLLSFSMIDAVSGDVITYTFDLDGTDHGWKYSTEEDIRNLCRVGQILSPYIIGASAYYTPDHPASHTVLETIGFHRNIDRRPSTPFLYSLTTAENPDLIDEEQVRYNPNFRRRYLSIIAAGEMLVRQLRNRPSYWQKTAKEYASYDNLSSRLSSFLSMTSFMPSAGYNDQEEAEAAVRHVLHDVKLDQGGIYSLRGDNMGGKEERGYDQYLVLYWQYISGRICRDSFNLHQYSADGRSWDDIIGEEGTAQRDAAQKIASLTDRDIIVITAFMMGMIDVAFSVAKVVIDADPMIGMVDANGERIGRTEEELVELGVVKDAVPELYKMDLLEKAGVPLQTDETANVVSSADVSELKRLAQTGWDSNQEVIPVPKGFDARGEDEGIDNVVERVEAGEDDEDKQDLEDEEEQEMEETLAWIEGMNDSHGGATSTGIVGRTNLIDSNNLTLMKTAHQDLANKRVQRGMAKAFIDALDVRVGNEDVVVDDGEETAMEPSASRFQEKIGVPIVMDNDPIDGLNRLNDEDRITGRGDYYPYLLPIMGGFHAVNKLHHMQTRNTGTVLGHFVSYTRSEDAAYNWWMLPRDPHHRERMLPVYVMARLSARIIQLERARERPVTAREVFEHARFRAEKYPVCLMLLQEEMLLMNYFILKTAERNGPVGLELFQTGLRFAGIQYAAGSAPSYVRSLCEMLKMFAMFSPLQLRVFGLFLFTCMTATGLCFKYCDLINENMINLFRQHVGKKKTRGWTGKIERVSAFIPDWLRFRWKDYEESGTDGVSTEQAAENRRVSKRLSDELETFFFFVVFDSISRQLDGDEAPLLGEDYVAANETEVRTLDGDLVKAQALDVVGIGIRRLFKYFSRYYIDGPLNQVKRRKKEVDLSRLQITAVTTEKDISTAIIRATSISSLELTKSVITIAQAKEEIELLRQTLIDEYGARLLPKELANSGVKHSAYVEQLITLRRRYFNHNREAHNSRADAAKKANTTLSTCDERKAILSASLYVGSADVLGVARYNEARSVYPEGFDHSNPFGATDDGEGDVDG